MVGEGKRMAKWLGGWTGGVKEPVWLRGRLLG
jgi:hypothetical protein